MRAVMRGRTAYWPTTSREVSREAVGRRRDRGFLSMIATLWPSRSRLMASSDPTRPQPTTTTCTGPWNTAPAPRTTPRCTHEDPEGRARWARSVYLGYEERRPPDRP